MDSPLSSARRVLPKALSALMRDGALQLWAARKNLGAETDALVRELRYAQAMVNTTRGREIDNPSLDALLLKVRLLAHDAAAVLAELDYFRVQDELDGADDVHAGGCALHGLLLRARRTARTTVAAKLKPSSGSRGTIRGEHDERDSSSKPMPINQDDQKINAKSVQMLASITRNSARRVGNERQVQAAQTPRLKFKRMVLSTKMTDIVQKLKPICAMVSTVLTLELLASRGITTTTM